MPEARSFRQFFVPTTSKGPHFFSMSFPDSSGLDLSQLLKVVIGVAEEASAAILEVYREENLGVSYKVDESPLTLADKRSHELIESRLSHLTPAIPVVSEESVMPSWETRKHWQDFWLIDPLDGTKEFVSRNGEFTVNIALLKNLKPVLGVMFAPALKTAYYAYRGGGAFKRNPYGEVQAIKVSDYRSGLVVAASRSHDREKMDALLKTWGPTQVLNVGSALKMGLVAEGTAHVYPRIGPTMEWDTAAAHCILMEAGGTLRLWDGSELRYNKPDLLNPGFVCFGNPAFPGVFNKL